MEVTKLHCVGYTVVGAKNRSLACCTGHSCGRGLNVHPKHLDLFLLIMESHQKANIYLNHYILEGFVSITMHYGLPKDKTWGSFSPLCAQHAAKEMLTEF